MTFLFSSVYLFKQLHFPFINLQLLQQYQTVLQQYVTTIADATLQLLHLGWLNASVNHHKTRLPQVLSITATAGLLTYSILAPSQSEDQWQRVPKHSWNLQQRELSRILT